MLRITYVWARRALPLSLLMCVGGITLSQSGIMDSIFPGIKAPWSIAAQLTVSSRVSVPHTLESPTLSIPFQKKWFREETDSSPWQWWGELSFQAKAMILLVLTAFSPSLVSLLCWTFYWIPSLQQCRLCFARSWDILHFCSLVSFGNKSMA